MKVFQINQEVCYAAESLDEAIRVAMAENGCAREDVVDEESLHELSDEELDTRKFHTDVDDPQNNRIITFREELANHKKAGFFSTTDI